MSTNQDEKLEAMLQARRIESASADLAQRIILKAEALPQIQTTTLGQWIQRLFAEFHLPKPAYVLAATLVLGFVVGLNNPLLNDTSDPDTISVNAEGFLYADEAIL
jgi:hypothetical protein